mmetsp:Transcript_14110/g.23052  ORF Transcript_14110/g.23052 Transcript_14110/m.23052 type:complete len:276 (-) Transcript_14110:681-1508(-)
MMMMDGGGNLMGQQMHPQHVNPHVTQQMQQNPLNVLGQSAASSLDMGMQQHMNQNKQAQMSQQVQMQPHTGNPLTAVRKTSCDSCTQIKVKCSGEDPCKRCKKKDIACVYSLSKKRGPPKGKRRAMIPKRARTVSAKDAHRSDNFPPTQFDPNVSLEMIRHSTQMFAEERDWRQFHLPRNLVLAMVGEVGEVAELFQWKDAEPGLDNFTVKEKNRVGEEIADVLLYLVQLADRCGIDLGHAALDKMKKNAMKYPIEKSKGSAKKIVYPDLPSKSM